MVVFLLSPTMPIFVLLHLGHLNLLSFVLLGADTSFIISKALRLDIDFNFSIFSISSLVNRKVYQNVWLPIFKLIEPGRKDFGIEKSDHDNCFNWPSFFKTDFLYIHTESFKIDILFPLELSNSKLNCFDVVSSAWLDSFNISDVGQPQFVQAGAFVWKFFSAFCANYQTHINSPYIIYNV